MNTAKRVVLSVIIPLFNEEANVDRLLELLQKLQTDIEKVDLELIFVDDGSSDSTFSTTCRLTSELPRTKLIRLARNFGAHAAIACGLCEATGDCTTFLAADLQDPPAVLIDMLALWRQGVQVVWAAQSNRKALASLSYWMLANWQTGNKFPTSGVDFALLDRAAVDTVRRQAHQDTCLFLQIASAGFESAVVWFNKLPRSQGRSGWTFRKKVLHWLKALTFTLQPFWVALGVSTVLSIAGAGTLVLSWLPGSPEQLLVLPTLQILLIAALLAAVLSVWLLAEYLRSLVSIVLQIPRFVIVDRVTSDRS